jgi:hypothetical protein
MPRTIQPPPRNGNPRPGDIYGVDEVQGPLVRQTASAARLARILTHAAEELFDLSTGNNAAEMWEDARAIASRILAAAPGD